MRHLIIVGRHKFSKIYPPKEVSVSVTFNPFVNKVEMRDDKALSLDREEI